MISFTAVIPAAGIGQRMQSKQAKQYMQLQGKSVLEHTLAVFDTHPLVSEIIVVVSPNDVEFEKMAVQLSTPLKTVLGGDERYDSVLAGLKSLPSHRWVLIHDAARPCLRTSDITRLIDSLEHFKHGAILASKVRDTMKRGDFEARIETTVERNQLWHAQTPQLFKSELLTEAIESALAAGIGLTDEAQAMEFAGYAVGLVEGHDDNLKITRPNDLALAQFYLDNQLGNKHA
ncbi:2-C-methyl-D-erythritol 4-phosphate cytidylyltransferase [Alginatibacterium sediminis]|uniref:2-C-methyl-D-erythritol 4-phosphate cytidylyltransferase n=1 Tax=Alginatibacterium sediminis TaxID=2164068 RepID=UPI001F416568|nr:2-C-methyl-D-erythritol 4-phosphate cytidylyltransferase [Alginatibacterium sediminis]